MRTLVSSRACPILMSPPLKKFHPQLLHQFLQPPRLCTMENFLLSMPQKLKESPNRPSARESPFLGLPTELIDLICHFCLMEDLIRLGRVNKRMAAIVKGHISANGLHYDFVRCRVSGTYSNLSSRERCLSPRGRAFRCAKRT